MASKLYTYIVQSDPFSLARIKQEWEAELEVEFQDPWWDKVKLQVNHSSSCAHLNLIQLC